MDTTCYSTHNPECAPLVDQLACFFASEIKLTSTMTPTLPYVWHFGVNEHQNGIMVHQKCM